MSEPSSTSEPSQPAKSVGVFGCLIILVVLTAVGLSVAAGFAARPKADGSVIVDDQANVLGVEVKKAIEGIRFPEDIPAVVRTVSSIPPAKIGTFATDLMSEERHWQTLRPRHWLRRYFRADNPSGTGVYILLSLDPQLVQIRFGSEIRMSAYQNMLAVGTWYRDRQRFERSMLEQHLLGTVRQLAEKTRAVAKPHWVLAWAQYFASWVNSEVEDVLAPSDGLFSNVALKNYILLASTFGATGSAWRFAFFSAVVFVVLWIGQKIVLQRLLLPRIKRKWLIVTLNVVSGLGLLGVLVTAFASLMALSKGRIEDELALQSLGLSFLSQASLAPSLFSSRGGLLLAIPGVLVSFISEVAESAEAQRHGETRLTFNWLGWGCMLFLMPRAIAIAAFVMLLWNTVSEIAAQETS